jgi:hypothetical protein
MSAVKRWLFWLVECLPVLIVLAFMSASQTGCIWLAVPGLAYEAYKYEHQSGTRSSPGAGAQSSDSQPISQDSTPYDD